MAYPPDYRYFSATDKHYVKNYGLTCIGILTMIIIFFIIISLPATIFWISSGYPWFWLSILLLQVGPLSVFLIVFIWLYKRRDDETGEDNLIPVERP
ncbi:MAG: hypothetical protein JW779_14135 [Candidatus Thorarchaeota archaeon]|nr:hypothetical protein [Candidatus Thorarchaeota archaeon]